MDIKAVKNIWVVFALGILTLLGIISLIIVGVTVVREYDLAKNFEPTSCTLRNIEDLGTKTCQYCYTTYTRLWIGGEWKTESRTRCKDSSFPCMRINVEYQDSNGDSRAAMYYPDVTYSTQSSQCSYYVCKENPNSNSISVTDFITHFRQERQHTSFNCFYDENKTSFVIGKKIYTLTEALIGMLIPAFIVLGAFIGIVFNVVSCKGHKNPSGFTAFPSHDETVHPTAPPVQGRHTEGRQTMPVTAHLSNQSNIMQPNTNYGTGRETQPLQPYPPPPGENMPYQPHCPPPSYNQAYNMK